jgi:hypothetical protein
MFPELPRCRLPDLAVLVIGLTAPGMSMAGWMGFRNDTSATLVIQETIAVGKDSRPGKPHKLYSNETIRDTPASAGGSRVFTIADAARPDKPLYSGAFACPAANENLLYVLKLDGKGGIVVEAVRMPVTNNKSVPKR